MYILPVAFQILLRCPFFRTGKLLEEDHILHDKCSVSPLLFPDLIFQIEICKVQEQRLIIPQSVIEENASPDYQTGIDKIQVFRIRPCYFRFRTGNEPQSILPAGGKINAAAFYDRRQQQCLRMSGLLPDIAQIIL